MDAFTAYELFVGQVTVKEFVAPFDGNIKEAVAQLMDEKWWEGDDSGTPAPTNLADLITEYCESHDS